MDDVYFGIDGAAETSLDVDGAAEASLAVDGEGDMSFEVDGRDAVSLAIDGGGAVSLFLDAPYVGKFGDYKKLDNKPSIEGVELEDDKLFPELGVFERDGQGYDVPDKYTLSTLDINSLWETAIPIGG